MNSDTDRNESEFSTSREKKRAGGMQKPPTQMDSHCLDSRPRASVVIGNGGGV